MNEPQYHLIDLMENVLIEVENRLKTIQETIKVIKEMSKNSSPVEAQVKPFTTYYIYPDDKPVSRLKIYYFIGDWVVAQYDDMAPFIEHTLQMEQRVKSYGLPL